MPQPYRKNGKQIPVTYSNLTRWSLPILLGIIGTATLAPATSAIRSAVLRHSSHDYSAIAQSSTTAFEGMTVEGQLDDSSAILENGSRYNQHTFEGRAGEQIAIELNSEEFDAYLIVIDPSGQRIEDNNSGSGSDALVAMTLPSQGTYTVLAISSIVEETGHYILQWRQATEADQDLVKASDLNQQVNQLYAEGRYAEAIPLAEQVLVLRHRVPGENHLDISTSLDNLARLYRAQGRYGEAELLFQQVLTIVRTALGEAHPNVAQSLDNLAGLYRAQGRYGEAEPLYEQALEIQRTALGRNHLDVSTSLNNLASLYQSQGRYSEAEPLFQEALEIWRAALGESHPNVGTVLNNLAELYRAQGRYAEAEPLYEQALEIRRTVLGKDHPNVAQSLNNLAELYRAQGRYGEAELFYEQALEIQRTALGKDHPDVAIVLHNLANLYLLQGRYGEAEPLYEQALTVLRTDLGANHPDVTIVLNDLASLYRAQGRYGEAETFYEQALEIRRTVLGKDHPNVAQSLNNLAELYRAQGRYGEAELFYEQALEIQRTALGKDHPDVAIVLHNLANLYLLQGRYDEAEPLYEQALTVARIALGEEHPFVAVSFNNLAELYRAQGRYGEAELFYEQALEIQHTALGKDHPDVAISLHNLAELYWVQNQLQSALSELQQGLAVEETVLDRNLISGSESNKRDYLTTFNGTTDFTVTLNLQALPQDSSATQLALITVLQRKGRLLDLFTNSQQILRNQLDDPNSQALLDQLIQARAQLSTLYFNRPATLPLEQYRQQISQLDVQIQQLEDQISRRSATFRDTTAPIDLLALQALLPTNGVLIEFVRYQIFDPNAAAGKRLGEFRYAAYLLHPDGTIAGIDLGSADTIDTLIADFSSAVRNRNVNPAQVKVAARELDAVIMAPVRSRLGNSQHLLISPDSALNLIPFESLVDENNQYLVENYTLTYLTSGRDLLRLQARSQPQQPPLLVADPIFNRPGETVEVTQGDSAPTRSAIDLSQLNFPPLEGTKIEVEAIAQLLQVQSLQGTQATEAVVKQTNRPNILHIATHGFFQSSDSAESVPTGNPLLRSGLVLAGFQVGQGGGGEDGILTALEVSSLNLLGTQMVVLSSCETGLGDLSVGEGVYGLRRALVLAGSESQVISLWRVQDKSTKDLMVAYYERLLQGEGRSEALRNVQLAMLKDEATAHPYYWSPFIHSGDWTPLN